MKEEGRPPKKRLRNEAGNLRPIVGELSAGQLEEFAGQEKVPYSAGTSGVELSKTVTSQEIQEGLFQGVEALFIAQGVNRRRFQVWQTRFRCLGGNIVELSGVSLKRRGVLHVLAKNESMLCKEVQSAKLVLTSKSIFIKYEWIEDCLIEGTLLSCTPYLLSERQTQLHSTIKKNVQYPDRQEKLLLTCPQASLKSSEIPSEVQVQNSGVITDAQETETTIDEVQKQKQGWQLTWGDEPLNLNKHITDQFTELWHIYEEALGDEWRAITYRKAANRISKLSFKISSTQQLKNLHGIGKSVIDKIKEILMTGRLQKLDNLKANGQVQVVQKFACVWGIGPKVAQNLYQSGYRTLQDLEQDASLSTMACLGLKYHNDISLRIPREEVFEVEGFVRKVLEDLCPGVWLTVGGSYRRGNATCGDIDLLITHPDGNSHEEVMGKLVSKLREVEFLTGCLTMSHEITTAHKVQTFMGICRLPQHLYHRRMDIKVYPMDLYPFALLYFTGNDVLNRRIRYLARTKGYKLSDQGLFLRVGPQKNARSSDVSIPCKTEKDIFEILGVDYPEPHERNW